MKVAIYCRLSEEDKNKQLETDDSGSIQNQKAMLLQYATEQGWELYKIYSDDDYAGADRRRPESVSYTHLYLITQSLSVINVGVNKKY